jgi:hypothetical protein
LDRLGASKAQRAKNKPASPAVLSRLGVKPGAVSTTGDGGQTTKRKAAATAAHVNVCQPAKKEKSAAAAVGAAGTSRTQPRKSTAVTVVAKKQVVSGVRTKQSGTLAGAGVEAGLPAVPADASPMMRFLLKKEAAGKLTVSQQAELSRLRRQSSVGGDATATPAGGDALAKGRSQRRQHATAPLELEVEVRRSTLCRLTSSGVVCCRLLLACPPPPPLVAACTCLGALLTHAACTRLVFWLTRRSLH